MNELMHAEIWDQPAALRQSLKPLRAQATSAARYLKSARRIIITGCGDSYFGALALQRAYQMYIPVPVDALPAMEAAQYVDFHPGDVLVAISVSGEVKRTLEAVGSARGGSANVVAITAQPESTLAKSSDAVLTLPVPSRSRKTPHTTDFVSTLLALVTLLESGANQTFTELDSLSEQVESVISSLESKCVAFASAIVPTAQFFFLGAGPGWAVAQYCAAKFWEAGGLRGYAFELEEFAHGAQFLLAPGDAVMVIAPDDRSQPRAMEMWGGFEQLGARPLVVTGLLAGFPAESTLAIPNMSPVASPFVACLPGQLLTLSVANVRGYDVVSKAGHVPDPALYEQVHRNWTGGSALRPVRNATSEDYVR